MKHDFRHALAALSAFAIASLATNALATIQRTFVASTGVDTNACSITAPCRGFAAAVAKTSANGEVIALDSAGYGPVVISKSISLIAPPGIYAGVTVFSGDGIVIDGPGIVVVLRGLSINGQGGQSGINLLQGARLSIESCVISNMKGDGILHGADGSEMIVLDTILRDNLGNGIDVLAAATVVLDHVRSEHNVVHGFTMLSLSTSVSAAITDSVFARNGANGINVDSSTPTSSPNILVDRSVLAENDGFGFLMDCSHSTQAGGGLTRNAIHRNGSGIRVVGLAGPCDISVSDNSFVENAGDITADGNVQMHVSGNRFAKAFGNIFSGLNGALIRYL